MQNTRTMSIAEELRVTALEAQKEIAKNHLTHTAEHAAPIIEWCREVASEWGKTHTRYPRGYRYDSMHEADIVAYLRSVGFKAEVEGEHIVIRW